MSQALVSATDARNWLREGGIAIAIDGDFGGTLPTLVRLGAFYSANPEGEMPKLGVIIGVSWQLLASDDFSVGGAAACLKIGLVPSARRTVGSNLVVFSHNQETAFSFNLLVPFTQLVTGLDTVGRDGAPSELLGGRFACFP